MINAFFFYYLYTWPCGKILIHIYVLCWIQYYIWMVVNFSLFEYLKKKIVRPWNIWRYPQQISGPFEEKSLGYMHTRTNTCFKIGDVLRTSRPLLVFRRGFRQVFDDWCLWLILTLFFDTELLPCIIFASFPHFGHI